MNETPELQFQALRRLRSAWAVSATFARLARTINPLLMVTLSILLLLATDIMYTWMPPPYVGQGTAVVSYTWATFGTQPISVTVSNGSDTAILSYGEMH